MRATASGPNSELRKQPARLDGPDYLHEIYYCQSKLNLRNQVKLLVLPAIASARAVPTYQLCNAVLLPVIPASLGVFAQCAVELSTESWACAVVFQSNSVFGETAWALLL
jgi:hypothetical protein